MKNKLLTLVFTSALVFGACGFSDGVEKGLEAGKEAAEETEEVEQKEVADDKDVETEGDDLEEINQGMEEYLEKQKGWAMGTLDENGEPTEDGEPDPTYESSLYINSLSYGGSLLDLQTDPEFLDLSDELKEEVARNGQNIASTVIGEIEDWDTDDYAKKVKVIVKNGDDVYGRSKLDPNDFTWIE